MSQNFVQESNLSDIILPLIWAEYDTDKKNLTPIELIGTGFLIGNRGFALTAGHVIDQLKEAVERKGGVLITHIFNNQGVQPFLIKDSAKHPDADVGIIKIDQDNLKTWLRLSDFPHNASAPYIGWGYPKETAEELSLIKENAKLRPDLIYTEGYIRRTINTHLPSSLFVGTKFYEVSDLGGPGYSGSPIIFEKSIGAKFWDVIGIYIGEKEGRGAPVGYVVRIDAVSNWAPELLGCTIKEESLKCG